MRSDTDVTMHMGTVSSEIANVPLSPDIMNTLHLNMNAELTSSFIKKLTLPKSQMNWIVNQQISSTNKSVTFYNWLIYVKRKGAVLTAMQMKLFTMILFSQSILFSKIDTIYIQNHNPYFPTSLRRQREDSLIKGKGITTSYDCNDTINGISILSSPTCSSVIVKNIVNCASRSRRSHGHRLYM